MSPLIHSLFPISILLDNYVLSHILLFANNAIMNILVPITLCTPIRLPPKIACSWSFKVLPVDSHSLLSFFDSVFISDCERIFSDASFSAGDSEQCEELHLGSKSTRGTILEFTMGAPLWGSQVNTAILSIHVPSWKYTRPHSWGPTQVLKTLVLLEGRRWQST